MEYTKLNNGVIMPKIGYGLLDVDDPNTCEQAVQMALKAGYRLLDTAVAYGNEEAVGQAIQKSQLDRESLFITTKVWVQDAGYEATKQAIQKSLDKLKLTYLDLVLIHFPFGDYYGSWRAMEELYEAGKIRAIGVSNFYAARLVDLYLNAKIKPMINQLEMNPLYQQNDALKVMKDLNIQGEAWRPLSRGRHNIFGNQVLVDIAEKYQKTVPQVMLRWNVQRGVVALPKSLNAQRMAQNIDIWDFSLSQKDMDNIEMLDSKETDSPSLTSAETAKQLNEWKIHD
ncbi:aldo/keto reductase [Lapidilactobacillus wuchangensis]|uniref:aldo/keto reductase n=1 Tax=Lapidilactobacillus wuchangensis TaxID=2486001 RepID=UPI000F7A9822|nr:aldo/keto reductase [Lapidilactobacillus wuchangensis]